MWQLVPLASQRPTPLARLAKGKLCASSCAKWRLRNRLISLALSSAQGVARSDDDSAKPLQAASFSKSFFCSARSAMFK